MLVLNCVFSPGSNCDIIPPTVIISFPSLSNNVISTNCISVLLLPVFVTSANNTVWLSCVVNYIFSNL